jgi:protein involved in polysaccharide export with SLBB domain
MTSMLAHIRLAALSAGLAWGAAVAAQPVAAPSVENIYARPGYPTIGVYVLGSVETPGKWRVEDGAPLIDLLAVSGPATASAPRGGVSERVLVRLYRSSGGSSRQLTLDSELEQLLLGSQAAMPLREGDLVRVMVEVTEPRNRTSFIEILGVVGTVASVAALVSTLVR